MSFLPLRWIDVDSESLPSKIKPLLDAVCRKQGLDRADLSKPICLKVCATDFLYAPSLHRLMLEFTTERQTLDHIPLQVSGPEDRTRYLGTIGRGFKIPITRREARAIQVAIDAAHYGPVARQRTAWPGQIDRRSLKQRIKWSLRSLSDSALVRGITNKSRAQKR
jgi:hypothetical protein